jgi:hypothetical protein
MGFLGTILGTVGTVVTGNPAFLVAGSSYDAARSQKDAARDASKAQQGAANAGIAEQQRQFDAIQKLLAPYVQSGNQALTAQGNLAGLNGQGAQSAAIRALEASPAFTALTQQGEGAILANASATGGLRGGNTQAALAQFRPQMLAQLIEQQLGRLGGISSMGANAAAGVGNAGMQTGANVSNLMQQLGAAQAGGALGVGAANAGLLGGIGQAAGLYGGLRGFGGTQGWSGLQSAFSQTGLGSSGFGSGLAYGNQDLGQFF